MVSKFKQLPEVEINTLNLLPVAVILFDNEKIHFLNKAALTLLKLPANWIKSPAKKSFFNFLEKKFHADFKKRNAQTLTGKDSQPITLELKDHKNKIVSIELKTNAVRFNKKLIVQGLITKNACNKEEERKFEYSRELLQKISKHSTDVIFHFEFYPQMNLKFISESSKKILGFTPEELYKNPTIMGAYIHEEDRKYIITSEQDYLKASNKNKDTKALVRITNKKGEEKKIEILVSPVYTNKKLTGIIGSMHDVTERVETELLLMETKEKFDLITNNGNDIIAFYTFLPEEKYLYVSPNIKKILGYTPKQLLEDNMFFNKRVIGGKDYFLNTDKQLISIQKKNIQKNCFYIFRILKNNKEEIWLESNFFPIINSKGKVGFFLNILRDVTEQHEKEIEIQNQYINYRNLLDNSPIAYIIHQQGVCLYCNNAVLKLLKIKNKNQILGKFIVDFFMDYDRKKAIEHIDHISAGKSTNKFINYTLEDTEHNAIEVEIKSLLIKFNDVDCALALINNLSDQRQREKEKIKTELTESTNKRLQKEIKDRKEVEKNLIEKTAHLSSIFESSTHLIWTVNRDYKLTSFNKNFYDVVMLQHNIGINVGDRVDELLLKNRDDYMNFWYPKYAETFKGKKLEFEKEDINNSKVYRKVFFNPIFNEENEVTEINCIAHDVTDSKIYEQKLVNQTGKLTAIFDSSHHYIWTINKEDRLTSFNKNYFDLLASLYNTEPYIGFVLNRGILSNDTEYNELMDYHYEKAFAGIATNFEIETLDKNYNKIHLEIFLNPIFDGSKVVEVSGIAHNITEKKHVQQRMEQSLKEKEILLKEVHHRVKNNMQVVSSILNLQSSYVSDEYALTLLKESQNRIKTMAYIHESLYQNKSFTSVNFSEYIQTLVNNIVQSYSASQEKIQLSLDIEKITLSLDISIPVGLIINELVTNAIKHGFPDSQTGNITIHLKTKNNFVFLELKDNGVGFASGVDFENSHSLGLQLVNTLIEQIEGKFEFESAKNVGTRVLITFKM
jgi:PAS domain S-box-containing protein